MYILQISIREQYLLLREFKNFQEAWDYTTKVHLADYNVRGAHLDETLERAEFTAERDGVFYKYYISPKNSEIIQL